MSSQAVRLFSTTFRILLGVFVVFIFILAAARAPDAVDAQEKNKIARIRDLQNYDIRTNDGGLETIAQWRQGADISEQTRHQFAGAENALRERLPTLKVEYNDTLDAPEVIASDAGSDLTFLTAERRADQKKTANAEILRGFLVENRDLVGLTDDQVRALSVEADYRNPDGVLAYAHLEQFINGLPVFQAEVKAGFTEKGAMFRVISNLAPALDYANVSDNFGDPVAAVQSAYRFAGREMTADDVQINQTESTDLMAVFGAGGRATTAEKMYFPVAAGAARSAWRVLIWGGDASYYVIVDAETGTLLWRKNITLYQTQSVTYNVYANSTSMIQALENPAPLTPGPADPNTGMQGFLVNRTNVTLIGNEGTNSFNNLGWITDGNNMTDGNNVQAGIDRDDLDGVDAPVAGSGTRVFNFNYTPGNLAGGDNPLGAEFQKGAVTQLFYLTNRYHDEVYKLGFTEAARNFQNENFGRGGEGGDRIKAEAQDGSGTNNATFAVSADGGRFSDMQMFLYYAPDPNRDGALDAEIVLHELTHGLSQRLIGNASGLRGSMGGGMGEGWSDFYGQALLSEPTDPIHGIYARGSYANQGNSGGTNGNGNYYYGNRLFPKAVKSFTGGTQNRPHNPLTFADIDSTQVNIGDGAFPARRSFNTTSVHDIGEVWSSALWEARARFIRRLGPVEGNRQILQFVTDGMKLTPNDPTFLQARDAIKQAAMAAGTSDDLLDVRIGFATRGMGDAAQITQVDPALVVESFIPAASPASEIGSLPISIISETVSPANNAPDPNETLSVSVPLQNYGDVNSGANVTVSLLSTGGITNPGAAQNYETLAAGGTAVTRNFTFDVPASAVRGNRITLTFQIQDGAASVRLFQIYTVATPLISNSSVTIVSEGNPPANNIPDPGETVTLSVPLKNFGNAASGANTTVTLLDSVGITPITGAQTYGSIAAGATVSRNHSFSVSASSACGSLVTLTFQIQDGPASLNFTRTYVLGILALTMTEKFDGVTAPALPAGWTSTTSGGGTGWTTSTDTPSNQPNAAFAGNPATAGLSDLESPAWNVATSTARLDFNIKYDTQQGWDGVFLEMKIGAGTYQDIFAAGGLFAAGSYDRTLNSSTTPFPGRAAWSGDSKGYIYSSVNLPASANGQTVRFRWRMASNGSIGRVGVWLDYVRLYGANSCAAAAPASTPAISGTIAYGNAIPAGFRAVSNVAVSSTAGSPAVSTTTAGPGATAGQYTLSGFGAGAYTVTPAKTGGQNGITSFDAGRIAQHTAGIALLTGNQLPVADVSNNGTISSFDAALVANYVVATSPGGTTGTWRFIPVNANYALVPGRLTREDYSALLMGEVSGNWNNTGARPRDTRHLRPAAGGGRGPEKSVAISAPHLVTPADREVLIPVSVDGICDRGIIAYEFDLRYDPSVIRPLARPVDLVGTASSKLSVAVGVEEEGLLRVAVYGSVPVDSNGVLLNLRFVAVGVPGSVSLLAWERILLNEDPTTTTIDGQIELSAATQNQPDGVG